MTTANPVQYVNVCFSNASASQLLFPDLMAKDSQTTADSSTTSSGVGAPITGYSHRNLLFDGEMNGGQTIDNVGGKVRQREVAAVDQTINTQERSPGAVTSQMTTFKPIIESNLQRHQVFLQM